MAAVILLFDTVNARIWLPLSVDKLKKKVELSSLQNELSTYLHYVKTILGTRDTVKWVGSKSDTQVQTRNSKIILYPLERGRG